MSSHHPRPSSDVPGLNINHTDHLHQLCRNRCDITVSPPLLPRLRDCSLDVSSSFLSDILIHASADKNSALRRRRVLYGAAALRAERRAAFAPPPPGLTQEDDDIEEYDSEGYVPPGYEAFESRKNDASSAAAFRRPRRLFFADGEQEDAMILYELSCADGVEGATTESFLEKTEWQEWDGPKPSEAKTTHPYLQVDIFPSSVFTSLIERHVCSDDALSLTNKIWEEAALFSRRDALYFPHKFSAQNPLVVLVRSRSGVPLSEDGYGSRSSSMPLRYHLLRFCFERKTSPKTASPFETSFTCQRCVIGRAVVVLSEEDEVDDEEGAGIVDSTKSDNLPRVDAERFVPEASRLQWEIASNMVLMVHFFEYLPEKQMIWLTHPRERMSPFDLSIPNIINILNPFADQTPFSHKSLLVDENFFLHYHQGIVDVGTRLQFNIATVDNAARYFCARLDCKGSPPEPPNTCNNVTDPVGSVDPFLSSSFDAEPSAIASACSVAQNRPSNDPCAWKLTKPTVSPTASHQRVNTDVVRCYLQRLLALLGIERLRCHLDLQRHDMYSIRWNEKRGGGVALRPPSVPVVNCPACCSSGGTTVQSGGAWGTECAYHRALAYVKKRGGIGHGSSLRDALVYIDDDVLLSMFPFLLTLMRPEDKLVTKLTVPGLAENYPLLSIGDAVRFQFKVKEMSLRNEVIGEIIDVVVKTETITIFLPPPFADSQLVSPFGRHPPAMRRSPRVLPYLQALLRTETSVVDAAPFLFTMQPVPFQSVVRKLGKVENTHLGIFDVRFGLFGGRGFRIAEEILNSALVKCQNFSIDTIICTIGNRHRSVNEKNVQSHWFHLKRILAPTLTTTTLHRSRPIREVKDRKQLFVKQVFHEPEGLNEEQCVAANDIVYNLHGHVPYLIYGPPGTGKTLTIVETIILLLKDNLIDYRKTMKRSTVNHPHILCCAPSDAACDVLTRRLIHRFEGENSKHDRMAAKLSLQPLPPSILRVNWYSRTPSSLPVDLFKVSTVNSRGFFTFPTAAQLMKASIVICPCFVAGHLERIRGFTIECFSHVFIDECSQAMEAEALTSVLPIRHDCAIVLAGDPRQLGPTVRDPVATRMGLGMSLQERLMGLPLYSSGRHCVSTMLVGNYRSHRSLLEVPSSLFYGGKLQCRAASEIASPFADFGGLSDPRFDGSKAGKRMQSTADFPLMFYDVSKGKELNKLDTPSYFNPREAEAVLKVIKALVLIKKVDGDKCLTTGEIAVITPFRAQVLHIRRILRANEFGGVNVGVVEDFQGQETKVVLISTVLTQKQKKWHSSSPSFPFSSSHACSLQEGQQEQEQSLGFMHDPKRFNVAITRAHSLCVIVGNLKYLESSGTYWTAIVGHIKQHKGMLAGDTKLKLYNLNDDSLDSGESDENGDQGVSYLMKKVSELNLLGSAQLEDSYNLSYYYEDVPQWKVMLT